MTGSVLVRLSIPEDMHYVYTFMCELEEQHFDYDDFSTIFTKNLSNDGVFYFTALVDNVPVGFISFHVQNLLHHCGKVGEIQEFFVDSSFRNKGVGKLLMKEVDQFAVTHELKSIEVTTNKKRIQNIEIYQRFGFMLTHNKFTKEL